MSDGPKFRKWSFVLYPEDDLADWRSWLSSRHIPCLAIYHYPENDETKPHVHVLVDYGSVKTRKQVIHDYDHPHVPSVGSPDFFSPVRSVSGLQRYFLHADDPDKRPYSVSDLVSLCGYVLNLGEALPEFAPLRELSQFACDFVSFRALSDFVISERPDLLGCLAKHAYFFKLLFDR